MILLKLDMDIDKKKRIDDKVNGVLNHVDQIIKDMLKKCPDVKLSKSEISAYKSRIRKIVDGLSTDFWVNKNAKLDYPSEIDNCGITVPKNVFILFRSLIDRPVSEISTGCDILPISTER